MSKARYIAFINDNYIYLLDNKKIKIYEKKFNNIKHDKIINEQSFYFEFNQFIHNSKIRIPIFGYKLKIIVNDNMDCIQREKYKEVFEDYFQKIEFINITEILALSKDIAAINVNKDYLDFYYLKNGENILIRGDKLLFNNNDLKLISHFINTIFNPKKIILFGNNSVIPKLTNKINKELNTTCTFQEKYTTYILNEYMNRNTL